MRLTSFRIQNYKKVRDTDWVNLEDVTVFVGKNEAGKSAIFRALSKLNPSDDEKYDGLKEFPRSRYTNEFSRKDWPVASGNFGLSPEDIEEIAKIAPELATVESVILTKNYANRWDEIRFQPDPKIPAVPLKTLTETAKRLMQKASELAGPEGKADLTKALKANLQNAIKAALPAGKENDTAKSEQVQKLRTAVSSHANEEWQQKLVQPLLDEVRPLQDQVAKWERLDKAEDWAIENVPLFVYFDKYDVLEAAIHIPTFLTLLQQNAKAPRQRVTSCLFRQVGLELQEMLKLGNYAPGQGFQQDVRRRLDEASIKANSASIAMTKSFGDWWEQRRHRFRYDFQGEYFRIWVSDDLDASEIELDQRSQGLQYFFSFYLVFLVEAAGAHQDAILVLDEPGTHLHGTAQAAIVRFLDKLSTSNQILYSTHSPFMVDAERLERARAVFESDDGTTKVSEDVWPKDKDSLFPLQAALGYQLAQSLFISRRQLVVEGATDYYLLKAVDEALAVQNKTRLRPDITLIPSAGLSKLLPLASMLMGHNVEVGALLDGDEPARKEGKKLEDKLLAGTDRRCLFVGDFVKHPAAELEDLFPPDVYLAAVAEAYPGFKVEFTADEKKIQSIVDRVTTRPLSGRCATFSSVVRSSRIGRSKIRLGS